MAEALLRHIDPRNFEPFSAGVTAQPLNPLSAEAMREIGIPLDHKSPKTVEEFRDAVFDIVITLDETTAGQHFSLVTGDTVHWKFDDPLGASSTPEAQRRVFRSVRDQIAQRLRLFAIVHVRPGISERTHFVPGQTSIVPAR